MRFFKTSIFFAISVLISSCGDVEDGSSGFNGTASGTGTGTGTGTGVMLVVVTDSASLSRATSFENGIRVSGPAPIPGGASGTRMEGPAEIPLTTNSVSELTYEVPLPDSDSKIGAVIVEFASSNEYFIITPEQGTPRGANRSIPAYTSHSDLANGMTANRIQCINLAAPCEGIQLVGQPLNSGGLSASINTTARVSSVIIATADSPDFSSTPLGQIQPDASRWTQPLEVDVSATPTGSGDLQITLTWGSTADMDLHIFEPGGSEIYWIDTNSPKGFLDVDDIDGFGPENVFYEDGHDSGNYRVEVHHFSGPVPTNYTVTITDNGISSTHSGRVTTETEEDIVTTIVSNGSATTGTGPRAGTITGNADFCYDSYPLDPCDLLSIQGGAISSSLTTSNTCSGLGYTSANSFGFGTQFGTFGQSSSVGVIGSCEVNF